ncbi:hypothetical protein AGMMS50276_33550 [Synergistales bacterium]|nr:hypothetical protein AGMMS50276_33550 [Synergistales bacterium]
MRSTTQEDSFENEVFSMIKFFFRSFSLGGILKKVGAYKEKGVAPVILVQKLFALVFTHKSLFEDLKTGDTPEAAKDTFYRFINSCHIN